MRVQNRQRAFSWALAAALSLAAPLARADDTTAEALFDEGVRAKRAGDFVRACPLLEQAVEQKGGAAVGGLLELGACWEKLGKTASAWAAYRRAAGFAKQQKDARFEAARDHVARMEPLLHKLTITVARELSGNTGLQIKRGNELVPREALALAVPVDPGALLVTAELAGKEPFRAELTIPAAAGNTSVTIPPWGASDVAPAPEKAPSRPVAAPPQHEIGTMGAFGIAVGVLGAAGVGTGIGLGLIAQSNYDVALTDPRHACVGLVCNAAGKVAVDDARNLRDGATIAIVVGSVALAGGVTMLVIDLAIPKQQASVALGPGSLLMSWRLP